MSEGCNLSSGLGVLGEQKFCPRVVNPSPGLKGSGEPLFSVSKFCKFVRGL
jgi:hypothetical protein